MTSLQSAKLLAFYGALDLEGPWQCSPEDSARQKHVKGPKVVDLLAAVIDEPADKPVSSRPQRCACTLAQARPVPLDWTSEKVVLLLSVPLDSMKRHNFARHSSAEKKFADQNFVKESADL